MLKEKRCSLPYNLQLFAEPSDGGSDNSNNSNNGSNGNSDDNGDGGNGNQDQNKTGEKIFTQSEVSAMMAKEKNEGKRAILKSLGFKDEEGAKKSIEEYNKYLESKKTDDEKKAEALKAAKSEKDEAIKRAMEAESKLACYNAGVSKDYIDDVILIASSKVSEDKTLDKVLEEMKKDKKYESFFGKVASSASEGTGSNVGHSSSNNGSSDEGIGKRLAERNKSNQNKKSSFFND